MLVLAATRQLRVWLVCHVGRGHLVAAMATMAGCVQTCDIRSLTWCSERAIASPSVRAGRLASLLSYVVCDACVHTHMWNIYIYINILVDYINIILYIL